MKKRLIVLAGATITSTSFSQILIDAKAGHSYGYVSKNKDLGFQSNSVEIGGQYLFENLHIPVGLGLTISRSQYSKHSTMWNKVVDKSLITNQSWSGKDVSELNASAEVKIYTPTSYFGELFRPYIKLGHTFYSDVSVKIKDKTDIRIAIAESDEKLSGSFHHYLLGLGGSYQITPEIGITGEFTYMNGNFKVKSKSLQEKDHPHQIDERVATHTLSIGIQYTAI